MLFRFPALFGALALGAMLLCLAAVALPLFVSATTSELLAQRIDDPSVTVTGAGVMFRSPRMPLTATTENQNGTSPSAPAARGAEVRGASRCSTPCRRRSRRRVGEPGTSARRSRACWGPS